jgi:hypothetical protein
MELNQTCMHPQCTSVPPIVLWKRCAQHQEHAREYIFLHTDLESSRLVSGPRNDEDDDDG